LKKKIHPWIRISRIFRDIPTHNIEAGAKTPHMRQVCQDKLKSQGYTCNCIKCREIKSIDICIDSIVINVDSYESSNGLEYFISAQTKDKQNIIGFLRLRIPPKYPIQYIPEIKNCALVRELHVYGQMVPTYLKNNKNNTQHKGIGKILLKKAETIAQENNLNKVAIISGIGVRKYYEKHGYRLDGTFMVKHLHNYYYFIILIRVLIICVMFLLGSLS
jgi:elongator complex protein 3